jgi:hypothetical protein
MKRTEVVRRFDLSKIAFYGVVSCGLLGLSFAVGLYSGAQRNWLYLLVTGVRTSVETSLMSLAGEASTVTGTHPTHFLQPSRSQGEGVVVNDPAGDLGDAILLSGFFKDTNELRLIRRNGELIARWPVSYYTIFPNPTHLGRNARPATNWNVDTHGALALPDGSVVFNFEWSGLVKLDRCGGVVWTVPRRTHHSVEPAEAGGFWVPSRRTLRHGPSPFPPFEPPITEDTILRISEDGKVLAEYSVPKIFYDNGLEAVLTATGSRLQQGVKWSGEIVHLNKVDELTSDIAADFPLFEAGDLALSLRTQNLVMVVDRHVSKVKWWRMGPWIRQHDPEFRRGGTIVVFNNNTYDTDVGIDLHAPQGSTPRTSNVSEVDPVSGEYRVLYGGSRGQELLSVLRGKMDVTPRGGLLITEFEGGRVLETDASGKIVWEYVNRYSREEVGEITEARLYPSGYFNVSDWSCTRAGK